MAPHDSPCSQRGGPRAWRRRGSRSSALLSVPQRHGRRAPGGLPPRGSWWIPRARSRGGCAIALAVTRRRADSLVLGAARPQPASQPPPGHRPGRPPGKHEADAGRAWPMRSGRTSWESGQPCSSRSGSCSVGTSPPVGASAPGGPARWRSRDSPSWAWRAWSVFSARRTSASRWSGRFVVFAALALALVIMALCAAAGERPSARVAFTAVGYRAHRHRPLPCRPSSARLAGREQPVHRLQPDDLLLLLDRASARDGRPPARGAADVPVAWRSGRADADETAYSGQEWWTISFRFCLKASTQSATGCGLRPVLPRLGLPPLDARHLEEVVDLLVGELDQEVGQEPPARLADARVVRGCR